ncbi:hypothetical protein F7731_07665 [Cytobacillus depressus]|uniref:Uncharacterized protein n=1 Tax=Cytobacillus depressus TaxID=1602942 RepID=A0A6L3V9J7_9BACI|nr:hypothetical protein [Cytobacillus depressus]KAB2337475.1 hypothetical protein F7731_07665 [Cytobacillus depressus]
MYKNMRLAIGIIICFFFTIGIFLPSAKANAENIYIKLDAGYNGKLKMGKGFPLTLHIENKGEAFTGDLLLNFHPSWNTGGTMSINVDLPANTTKSYQVSSPGLTDDHPSANQNLPSIHLYKGDWRNGKKVNFAGEDKIKPKYIDLNEDVIGVLSENFDRLKELRILPFTQMQMIELKKEQLPKQALGLEMIDYLLIDEYPLSQLNGEQQDAIVKWVEGGGILIAGGAPNGSQSYGQLYSLLPMKMDNELTVPVKFLLQAESEKNPGFNEIQIFTGPLNKNAMAIDESDSVNITAKKRVGEGTILQTGFSLGDEPLSSWKGYSTWFAKFMNEAEKTNNTNSNYGPNFYDTLYWELADVNEFFPASSFSIGQLIGILGGYIIIIVPVLYFVLRKMDKREHSWWIIPTVAILMAAIVFGIGAKDRIAKPQLNQLGVYQVNDHQLTGIQAATLLSNKSGTYTLSVPKEQFNAITSTQNMSSYDPLRGAIYEDKRKNINIVFPEVGYWSSKTIFGKANQVTDGSFTADLKVKSNQITGTIYNGFAYDFEEIFIWSGNEKIKLGPIKKGETIQVNKQTKNSLLTKPYNYGGPNYQNTDLNKMKRERLEYAASNFIFTNGTENKPVIGGFTTDAVVDVQIVGKKEKRDTINLILDSFEAEQQFAGAITIRDEMLVSHLNVIKGQIFEKMVNGTNKETTIDDGEYEYIVQLPKELVQHSIKVNEILIRTNHPSIQYSVFNTASSEWLPIEADKRSLRLNNDSDVQQYLSKAGEIKLKLIKNAKSDPYVQLPAITIKGEVAP